MQLQDIVQASWPLYAHRGGNEKELLQTHIARCEKYRDRIMEQKGGQEILRNFFAAWALPQDAPASALATEMFMALPLFHDLGKIRPSFQKNKMDNTQMPKLQWGKGQDTEHSLLSAILYLDFYLEKAENCDTDKLQKRVLTRLAWENAYVISRHHSDLSRMGQFMEDITEKEGGLLMLLEQEPLPGYGKLSYLREADIQRKRNQYDKRRENMERDMDIAFFFYCRFAYSILVAGDYYGTTEYMSGVEVRDLGNADYREYQAAYGSTDLLRTIREYEAQRCGKEELVACKDINLLRNELFLDTEQALKEAEEENLFFLEAPTGSGKSNTAVNLSFHLLQGKKKLFYIYPFNTLVEQNAASLRDCFGGTDVAGQIAVVNSLTPFREKGYSRDHEDVKDYYQQVLLDRQFLNYPFILSTHVSFFNILFGKGKEDVMGFYQLANSVVVLDEVQSYRNAVWAEIMIFIKVCARIMGMKILFMSATLPGLESLAGEDCRVKRLMIDPAKYFLHPLFQNRVCLEYGLLEESISLETLLEHVASHWEAGKRILVTFIRKASAYQFYGLLREKYGDEKKIYLLTGDDSMYEREQILRPIREDKEEALLVSTQVVEAGVDIDMDIGYKDISKLDSEEQFLGRINRSGKRKGLVFFFDLDNADRIYRDDYRMDADLTLKNPEMKTILREKTFSIYYQRVLEALRKKRNEDSADRGLDFFFHEQVKKLYFTEIEKRMRMITQQEELMSIILCRSLVLEEGKILDGYEVWEKYKGLLQDREMEYAKKQVFLSKVRSELHYFMYQVKRNPDLPYDDIIGELYCIREGEAYYENGKLNKEKLEQNQVLFIE